ncbi:MAG TPA: DNA repair protein RecN [Acidimicrobiales bacterium]|nr:DNA repair protein RecN [Acidimicrobiales bacterium]
MLWELRVQNLGVIDDVTVTLGPGMTALTGETGAGKTLLVEALALLLGGRADPMLVRTGATEAIVEGRFAEVADEQVILARAVAKAGRSRAWVDGRMASVSGLAEVGAQLVELHGQHLHQSLVQGAAQRAALDGFADIDLTPMHAARNRLRVLEAESAGLGGDARQRAREADLLAYQIAEIEAAALEDAAEDDRLEAEEDRLAAASAHREAAAIALEALTGTGTETEAHSAQDRLAEAAGALSDRLPLAPLEERSRAMMAELADLGTELRQVVETWDDDPERLEAVRARRQLLHELGRKYGTTPGEVIGFAEQARTTLADLQSADARAVALDGEIEQARAVLAETEAVVARRRHQAAPVLADQIESTLRTLAMPSARFEVSVAGEGPADQVTFLLGANPGEPPLPMAKVASGGELARTMLAVRLALTGSPGVIVFDEVDAGIGGMAATAVGAALATLAERTQVLVVTHLAQVAAHADRQVSVRKDEVDGRTVALTAELDPDERVIELSRMLSGSPDSDTARRHARELLEGSRVGRPASH